MKRSNLEPKPHTTKESALLLLMREIDKHEDLDNHSIRKSDAYEAAVKELGWDIDWAELYERREANR